MPRPTMTLEDVGRMARLEMEIRDLRRALKSSLERADQAEETRNAAQAEATKQTKRAREAEDKLLTVKHYMDGHQMPYAVVRILYGDGGD